MDFLCPSPKRGDVEGFTLTSVHTETNGHIQDQRHKECCRTAGVTALMCPELMENVSFSDLNLPFQSDRLPAPDSDPTGNFGQLSRLLFLRLI